MSNLNVRWKWAKVTIGAVSAGDDVEEEHEAVLIWPEGMNSMEAMMQDAIIADIYGEDADLIAKAIVSRHNKSIDGFAP